MSSEKSVDKSDETDKDDVWKDRAWKLLNEDPEQTDLRIEELKQLVAKEPGLRVPDERQFYLKFLRAGLSDPKSGFDILKNFFTLKSKNKYFEVRRMEKISRYLVILLCSSECYGSGKIGKDDI